MFKRYERGRGNAACGIGENREARIRDKWLGSKVFWRLKRNREIRQILEIDGEVTARQEPRPTGRAQLPLSPIQSPVIVSLGQTSWADKVGGLAAGIFHCQIKCLTVIHLIRGWAVTTYDFHEALLERWTGGIYRPAIRAKQRLDRRQRRQRRASPRIRFWVPRVTGVCEPVPVPRRSADIPVCGCWGLSSPYLFSLVGTSRCDVRAACSGATPSNADDARLFVPPATTRAGMAQRAIPTIPLNTYLARRRRARAGAPKRPQTIGLQRVKRPLISFLTFPSRYGRLGAVMQAALSDQGRERGRRQNEDGSRDGAGRAMARGRRGASSLPGKGKCGMEPRLPRLRGLGGAKSRPRSGQPNGKMFAYVRLCSPMFALLEKNVRGVGW